MPILFTRGRGKRHSKKTCSIIVSQKTVGFDKSANGLCPPHLPEAPLLWAFRSTPCGDALLNEKGREVCAAQREGRREGVSEGMVVGGKRVFKCPDDSR